MRVVRSAEGLLRGSIYRSIDIAASGMTAQRMKMDAISSNIANVSTTNADGNGNPYLRKHVVMETMNKQTFTSVLNEATVKLSRTRSGHISPTQTSRMPESTPLVDTNEVEIPNMRKNVVYDPTHPDAGPEGFVVMPDINVVEEMVDLMVASRSFDANVTVVNAAKNMISKSLEI